MPKKPKPKPKTSGGQQKTVKRNKPKKYGGRPYYGRWSNLADIDKVKEEIMTMTTEEFARFKGMNIIQAKQLRCYINRVIDTTKELAAEKLLKEKEQAKEQLLKEKELEKEQLSNEKVRKSEENSNCPNRTS